MLAQLALVNALRNRREIGLLNAACGKGFKRRLKMTASGLALACGLHTGAMMHFEKMPLEDAMWLTGTTVATVGYGDLSAKTTAGRVSTGVLMYAFGIALLAQMASLTFERNQIRRDRIASGKWRWKMKDHIVILGTPKEDPIDYLKRFARDFRESCLAKGNKPIVIVSPDIESLPDDLTERNVAFVREPAYDDLGMINSNISEASTIVVMCEDDHDPRSDSITLDLITQARAKNPGATIIAEAVLEHNRDRFLQIGANQVIRPLRACPELLSRAILSPGVEHVFEDLMTSKGAEPVAYPVNLRDTWANVVMAAVINDIGTPLGIITAEGKLMTAPHPQDMVDARVLLATVREGNVKTAETVQNVMAAQLAAIKPPVPAAA